MWRSLGKGQECRAICSSFTTWLTGQWSYWQQRVVSWVLKAFVFQPTIITSYLEPSLRDRHIHNYYHTYHRKSTQFLCSRFNNIVPLIMVMNWDECSKKKGTIHSFLLAFRTRCINTEWERKPNTRSVVCRSSTHVWSRFLWNLGGHAHHSKSDGEVVNVSTRSFRKKREEHVRGFSQHLPMSKSDQTGELEEACNRFVRTRYVLNSLNCSNNIGSFPCFSATLGKELGSILLFDKYLYR